MSWQLQHRVSEIRHSRRCRDVGHFRPSRHSDATGTFSPTATRPDQLLTPRPVCVGLGQPRHQLLDRVPAMLRLDVAAAEATHLAPAGQVQEGDDDEDEEDWSQQVSASSSVEAEVAHTRTDG